MIAVDLILLASCAVAAPATSEDDRKLRGGQVGSNSQIPVRAPVYNDLFYVDLSPLQPVQCPDVATVSDGSVADLKLQTPRGELFQTIGRFLCRHITTVLASICWRCRGIDPAPSSPVRDPLGHRSRLDPLQRPAMRVGSIGCSDFSSKEYTCCDSQGLEHFALQFGWWDCHSQMKEIPPSIPNVKVIGRHGRPQWWKVGNTTKQKHTNRWTDLHPTLIIIRHILNIYKEMDQGLSGCRVPIYAITPQNEPPTRQNCASSGMPVAGRGCFSESAHWLLRKRDLHQNFMLMTIIMMFIPIRSISIKSLMAIEGSEYVVGAAFHNYLGEETARTRCMTTDLIRDWCSVPK